MARKAYIAIVRIPAPAAGAGSYSEDVARSARQRRGGDRGRNGHPPRAGGKPVRVLIVEDSSIVCERLAEFISSSRGVVLAGKADTGYRAREIFRRERPDAVILDLQLPDIDGMELITLFKAEDPGCVLVVLTTYGFEEFRQRCTALGADCFFDKSKEFERAVEVLEEMVRH